MVTGGELTWGGEHTLQYTDGISQNWTFATYLILLTNVTGINLMGKEDFSLSHLVIYCQNNMSRY